MPIRIVWEGESCFLLASRISYLPLYDAQISRYFGRLMAASTLHLACGKPLPWYLPIGVIYDLCNNYNESTEPELAPFLEFHVPNNHQMHGMVGMSGVGIDQVASGFYGRLKEADALSSGSSVPKVIPLIASSQQAAIFDTIVTGNFAKHVSNRPRLIIQKIPIRLYLKGRWSLIAAERAIMFFDFLKEHQIESAIIIIQGIKMTKDAKLIEIYEEMTNPDGFLYIISHTLL